MLEAIIFSICLFWSILMLEHILSVIYQKQNLGTSGIVGIVFNSALWGCFYLLTH